MKINKFIFVVDNYKNKTVQFLCGMKKQLNSLSTSIMMLSQVKDNIHLMLRQ